METAAYMAEQAGEKADHGTRHAGHLDQEAEEHEQRHREQDEVAHALVHAPDHDHLGGAWSSAQM